jgi:hypothetical protein
VTTPCPAAPVIYAALHDRHRPDPVEKCPEAKVSVAWSAVEMTGFGRPGPSERSEDHQNRRTHRLLFGL